MLRPRPFRLRARAVSVRQRPFQIQFLQTRSTSISVRQSSDGPTRPQHPQCLLQSTTLPLRLQLSLPVNQKRTLRTLPISKQKHPKPSRYNNNPRLTPLDATPAGAYSRRLIADSLPLRTGVLAVKKGMTAIYIDASGVPAAGSSAATSSPSADASSIPGQAADGAAGHSRTSRAGADTTTQAKDANASTLAPIGKPFEGGRRIPATVLQIDRNQVVANKTRARNGYYAVVVGEGWRKPNRVGRAMMGMFAKAQVGEAPEGSPAALVEERNRYEAEAKAKEEERKPKKATVVIEGEDEESELEEEEAAEEKSKEPKQGRTGLPPKREIREFKIRDANGLLPIGAAITPSHFSVGQYVDARGTARGMGFAGGMKRHGWAGQPASHGVSKTHRSMGSSGGGQGSGSRVIPGKKMAGNMGGQRHTVQNLKVLLVDETNGLVVVTGAVSGRKGDLVMLSDALKKPWPKVEAVA